MPSASTTWFAPSLGRRCLLGAFCAIAALSAARFAHADDWEIERSAPQRARPHKARSGPLLRPARSAQGDTAPRDLKLALERPYDEGVLERLSARYRARDGNLDGLLRELEQPDEAHRLEQLVLKARLLESLGQLALAREALSAAVQSTQQPNARLLGLFARLERRDGALDRAQALLQQALAPEAGAQPQDRRELLEALGELELDRKDYDAAQAAFGELSRLERGSVFAATAFARALSARAEHARAAQAYRAATLKLSGDPRALAPVLLEQASAEIEAGEHDRALETLARAQRMTAAAGLAHAVSELKLSAHRRAGSLRSLADELSGRGPRSFEDAELLARVYEELGEIDAAQGALRKALGYKPRDAQTRLRLVRLLTAQGKLGEAIVEHERLVRSAPGEPRYVTGLAQTLLESGQRARALALLKQTAARFSGDARVARALLDVYARWGEVDRAREMVERLARLEPGDPSHLITLGQELLQEGDEAGSKAAFARALERATDRASAHASLGEIFLDHEQPDRALEHFEQAVRLAPDSLSYARGLAEALERTRRFADAEAQWKKVMELAGSDRLARREARRRIVLLWANSGDLRGKLRELERAFGMPPSDGSAAPAPKVAPDLEAGRMLAEGYRALATAGRRARADATLTRATEQVLMRLLALAPGDLDAMIALERLRASRGDLRGASEVLEKLIAADPASAPAYLAQLAQYAQLDYRDAEALAYAERLAALAPNDPAAHTRLAELYRARQDIPRAAHSLERALELDPNAHASALELAELWLATGQNQRADGLLRRVLAGSPDDELVRRAARALLQLHLGAGTLSSLESDFLALALRGDRAVHRELLIELYASLCRPLLAQSSSGDKAEATAAREALHAIGRRALKPLLEALSARDTATRSLAIEVLGASQSEAALLPLLVVAEGEGELALRRRALLAVGPIATDAVLERLVALAQGAEPRLREAAAWAIARASLDHRSQKAERAAMTLTQAETPVVRGYGLLALMQARSKSIVGRAAAVLEHDRSPWARGAAALVLGHAGGTEQAQPLIATLQVESDDVSAAAALSLGMLRARDAARSLAARLVEGDVWSSRASAWALSRIYDSAATPPLTIALAPPGDRASLVPILSEHFAALPTAPGALRQAFDTLVAALRTALSGPVPAARAALHVLADDAQSLPGWDDSMGLELAAVVAPSIVALSTHRDSELRRLALALVLRLGPESSLPVLARALMHDDRSVRIDALDALEAAQVGSLVDEGVRPLGPPPEFTAALIELAQKSPQWAIRKRAVELLGRLFARATGQQVLGPALIEALEHDASAYVREAAAAGLGAARKPEVLGAAGRAALERAAARDPEALVRNAASSALSSP